MPSALTFLASIPSPSSGTIDLGPLTIHMYGLMLLAGIAACIALTGYRWVRRGGDWDLIFRVAVWGVGAGIVGGRARHLGRDRRGRPRRRLHREALGGERPRAARRRGAGPPRRAGDRPRR